ncbi:MAG TPA: serine/threonine-protein kinase [Gemmatimonadales bacterium]|nr:serine/threonine-protein kinase [Gemmatimonadales bacterium]
MTAPAEESLRASYLNSLPRPGEAVPDGVDPALVKRLVEALGPNYVVGDRIARGGFCEILECCDMELDRRLAIKVLRPDVGGTQDMRARFKQEARAIARLTHPNIIPIHFIGEAAGLAFYAMPFVAGRTLADLLGDQSPLPARRLVPLLIPVLEALHHAHQLGIVHRDIKPDNILIEDESRRPLLLDFGIAKVLTGAAHQTQAGFIVGTPLYMSPEQALGRDPVDARSDVYAFGVMMFQLVTGTAPYDGQTSQEIVGRHLGDPVPVPSARHPNVPGWLSAIIVRCLAKKPADRFASAHELADALRAGLAASGRDERPRTPMPDALREGELPFLLDESVPSRGRGLRLALGGAGIAAALAIGFLRPAPPTTVHVRNALVHPVELTLADGSARRLAPGDSLELAWGAEGAFEARWTMVRPTSRTGRPMGEALAGVLREERPRGAVRYRLDAKALDGEYFAPRVTNTSGVPLRFAVELPDGARLCDCDVPAQASDEPMGYYRLAPRTVVRLHDRQEREVRYDLRDPIREPLSGVVAVRVEPGHLPREVKATSPTRAVVASRPPRRSPPRLTPARREVLGASAAAPPAPAEPPVPVAEAPAPAPEPVVDTAPAPARKPAAPVRPANPLSGFLPVR